MAFLVEDGTGLAGATSLVDHPFVTSYLGDRGRSAENGWGTATKAEKQAACVKATDHVEQRFARYMKGQRLTETQALSLPRVNLWADGRDHSSTVPAGVQKAVAEYAVRALLAELQPDPALVAGVQVAGSGVGAVSSKTDSVAESVSFSHSGAGGLLNADGSLRSYPVADLLLQPFLNALTGRTGRA